jgi:K+-transporting ATPase ATPase A chain
MTAAGVTQILLFFAIILACARPMGAFMARLFAGERTFLHPILRPLERAIYALARVREDAEQRWTAYAGALIAFSLAKFVFTYAIQRLQGVLPLNPQGFSTAAAPSGATAMTPDLAFNTAVSFVTNTNWQSYVGETTLSYFVQMAALTVQNFTSAAAGIAIAVALIRGFARQEQLHHRQFLGRHRAGDGLRAAASVAGRLSAVRIARGDSELGRLHQVTTVEGATQTIAQGPVASQEAIKMLGTNGGGFFNANSAHPFENPTPLTTTVQILLIFLIPAGLTYTFGKMVGDVRQGWALFAAMSVMFLIGVFVAYGAEQQGNPLLAKFGVEAAATGTQPGGNMEGKETRFGIVQSALFATVTTDASCGAVNAMHDSFTPLGRTRPALQHSNRRGHLWRRRRGLYGILLYAILAVFIAGLMSAARPSISARRLSRKK